MYCDKDGGCIVYGRLFCEAKGHMSKPPIGVKPASIAAWQRIGDLVEAIQRQYESADRNEQLCKSWAQEIVMQCDIITEAKKVEQNHA